MPVSFGLRDEENERINNILKKLMSLVFVPDNWDEATFTSELKRLSLTLTDLISITNDELIAYLSRYHFDFENMEAFADVLAQLGNKPGLEKLSEKALSVYMHVQANCNAFSFGINNKISALRK